MLKFIAVAALVLWLVSRARLWKRVFNLRREIRRAVRRRSFGQYYVAVRWRELAGFLGFGLAAFSAARDAALTYGQFGRWVEIILYVLYAGTAFYALYLAFDLVRLRRRFSRLLERMSRPRRTARYPAGAGWQG